MVIVEYSPWIGGGGFRFNAKLSGSAGFNIEVDATNPTLSASKPVNLIPAGTTFAPMSLGGSLSLGFKLGGLDAVISGSGGATGRFNFKGNNS